MSVSKEQLQKDKKYILALDAGGTMTDTILVKDDGTFTVGKALTNKQDEAASYKESVEDAAQSIGITSREAHENASVSIYAGTGMLNTLLTGTGKKVGLLVTRGFEDMSIMEGGLTYLGQTQSEILHNQLHKHTRPMVDRQNVHGVSERISGGSYFMGKHIDPGTVMVPLCLKHIKEGVKKLIKADVEVIGILFINSYIEQSHEHKAKSVALDMLKDAGIDIPVVCSSDIAPVSKENNRLKSLLLQCFAAEHTRETIADVEKTAIEDGYSARLLTLLSYGGAVNVEYPRLYETVISGPIGGMMGAQVMSQKLGLKNVCTADMGGTSFDVGLIVNNMLSIRKDPDFAGHRLALPMVAIDSVGSGAGSAVWIDEYKRLHVGPESAGAEVGICYKYDKLTVTDVNVAMGYVDPDYFLGGKVKLDVEKAKAALKKVVADPLGLDIYQAGKGILSVVNAQMRDAAKAILVSKGYNTGDFTMMCYGGAGPVHMWGYTQDFDLADVITFPYAAAFSAFGGACAEYLHRYHMGVVISIPNGSDDAGKMAVADKIDGAWRSLEAKAIAEMASEGIDSEELEYRYGFYGRYMGQLESFETLLDEGSAKSPEDIDKIIAAFEEMYTNIYPDGARFPDAGYAITEVFVQAVAPKAMPEIIEHEIEGVTPPEAAYVETRQVSHEGEFHDFKVWQMSELKAGNIIHGPSIIRDPMTTVIIPPEKRIEIDNFMVLHYR
ncbi:MAG: hydantoinase/oxoprolinase family protein [Cycloclasticus sp.]|jgi:N-methylhydantoinase A|nr:hydantoinase/oxoprolinase family protein [Cycloclasticus sp.]HIL92851.1 hydantoinase/oxoprolinase family protein [Cycloclasticus sp.]